MVVIEINIDLNEITCRWVDNKGTPQSVAFMAEDLEKLAIYGQE